MTPEQMKEELRVLLEETTTALGGTNQTYIRFLTMLNEAKKLSTPRTLFPGQLVFFKYEPQNEDFLSKNTYYDRFPLVMITKTFRRGFYGINLHMLSPQHREILFELLNDNLPTVDMGEPWRKRLRIDYERLNSRLIFKFFRPCYRKYNWTGLMRRPAIVPYDLWKQMVMSDTFRFVNAKAITVFRESYKKAIRQKKAKKRRS